MFSTLDQPGCQGPGDQAPCRQSGAGQKEGYGWFQMLRLEVRRLKLCAGDQRDDDREYSEGATV